MAESEKSKIYRNIQNVITDFWTKYSNLLENTGTTTDTPLTVKPQRVDSLEDDVLKYQYTPVFITDVPHKPASQKKYCVLIYGDEVIKISSGKCIKSNNYLFYFKQNDADNKYMMIDSFHFDYDLSQSVPASKKYTDHPLYHAQIGAKLRLKELKLPEDLEGYDPNLDDIIKNRMRVVRIPTPQMNLMSIYLLVMLNHMNVRSYEDDVVDLIEFIENKTLNYPTTVCDSLINRISDGRQCIGAYWYH